MTSSLQLRPQDCNSLVNFLQKVTNLRELNLSGCRVPLESLKAILTSVSSNVDLSINLADNAIGVAGANIIAKIPFDMNNISSLNLSNNELGEEGIANLVESLCSNTSIRHLTLDQNLKVKKKKNKNFVQRN